MIQVPSIFRTTLLLPCSLHLQNRCWNGKLLSRFSSLSLRSLTTIPSGPNNNNNNTKNNTTKNNTKNNTTNTNNNNTNNNNNYNNTGNSPPKQHNHHHQVRLSKLLSQYATNLTISRNAAETLIKEGEVSMAGTVVRAPHLLVDLEEIRQSGSVVIKVQGKGIQLDLSTTTNNDDDDNNNDQSNKVPVVYAVHKLVGEMVTENDPQNRRSMMQRLVQGGVGVVRKNGTTPKRQLHLKPIGRLDMQTEGLILVTNDGEYAREMELPHNQIHRVYRARVHGRLTPAKLNRIRSGGIRFKDNTVRYGPMKVELEKPRRNRRPNAEHSTPSNTWVQVTSIEGKFRQIRNVFEAVGVTVTRLIRIRFGDYSLQTIPPGMAIEVPYKPIHKQKARGPLVVPPMTKKGTIEKKEETGDIKWVRSIQ